MKHHALQTTGVHAGEWEVSVIADQDKSVWTYDLATVVKKDICALAEK